jgi:hypothetical protein
VSEEREYTVSFTKPEQESVDFFLAHMESNKAFRPGDPPSRLGELRRRYREYRRAWRAVPEEAIRRGLHEDFVSAMRQAPLSIDIETAALCDLACPHCFRQYIVTPDKLIDSDLCLRALDQASELGVPSVKFNWRGEPLLHPGLSRFIAYAKERGILETIVNTNAVALDEGKAEALVRAGLDLLVYSFDGGTPATYEKVRVGRFAPNRFSEVCANIERFLAVRSRLRSPFPRTRIQMVLTPDAIAEVGEFRARFEPIVDDVLVKAYEERGWGLCELTAGERARLGPKASGMVWRKPGGEVLAACGRLPCQQPFQRLMVAYDGGVYMCCNDWGNEHPVGFLAESGWALGDKDYRSVRERIESGAKGFSGMRCARMPRRSHEPARRVGTLREIWDGPDINAVRRAHVEGRLSSIAACAACTFRDTFRWEKI